jgi:hypothetical protein
MFIGPDSAKSSVSQQAGRVYRATDTQVEYYSDGTNWVKFGVGSDQESVPQVQTDELKTKPQLNKIATLSDSALGSPHDIEIREGTGVTAGKDGNVCCVGLYPRASPTVVGSSTNFTNAETVAFYPANYPQTSVLIGDQSDISSVVAAPGNVGSVSKKALTTNIVNGSAWFHGDDTKSDYLFTAQKNGSVAVFDVSDFNSVDLITDFSVLTSPHDVAILGNRVVACEQNQSQTPKLAFINGFSARDTDPKTTFSLDTTFSDSRLDGANRLETLSNEFLVVANNYSHSIATVRVPEFVASSISVADTASVGSSDGPSGLSVVGDYAITASLDRVNIWDLRDPTNIQRVDTHIFSTPINGHDMAVDGRYCYVTGQATNTIEVFDLGYDEYESVNRARDLVKGFA